MALQKINLDKIVNNQDVIIDSLKTLNQTNLDYFAEEMRTQSDKFDLQKKELQHEKNISASFQQQLSGVQKQERRHKREKVALGGALVVVIILALVK